MSDHLPTYIWVDSLVRRAGMAGAGAYVVSKGDRERGDVLVKVSTLNGEAALFAPSALMAESQSFDWLPDAGKFVVESDVDELVQRRRRYDPDLWVVEIEDRDGRHFLTETVNGERTVSDPGI